MTGSEEEGGGHGEDSLFAVDPLGGGFFLFLALFIGVIVRSMGRYSPIPYTVTLFVIGILLGVYVHYVSYGVLADSLAQWTAMDPHLILFIFLPALIFSSALSVDTHVFFREIPQMLVLALAGVILSTVLTASFAFFAFDYSFSWEACMAFGAMLSATDPVAVVALLKEMGASKKLSLLIEGESLWNDGTAMVVFIVYRDAMFGQTREVGETVAFFAQLSFGGVALGLATGAAIVWWLGRERWDVVTQITITLFGCYLVFFLSEGTGLHLSGILAVVVQGLVIASSGRTKVREHESMHHFWEMIEYFANTIIFIVAGVVIFERGFLNDEIRAVDFGYNVALYLALLAIRSVVCVILWPALAKLGYGIDSSEVAVLSYAGLRGAVGLVLALIVENDPRSHSHELKGLGSRFLFHMAGITTLTLLINGTTTGWLLKKLGLSAASLAKARAFFSAVEQVRDVTSESQKAMRHAPYLQFADWNTIRQFMDDVFDELESERAEIEERAHETMAREAEKKRQEKVRVQAMEDRVKRRRMRRRTKRENRAAHFVANDAWERLEWTIDDLIVPCRRGAPALCGCCHWSDEIEVHRMHRARRRRLIVEHDGSEEEKRHAHREARGALVRAHQATSGSEHGSILRTRQQQQQQASRSPPLPSHGMSLGNRIPGSFGSIDTHHDKDKKVPDLDRDKTPRLSKPKKSSKEMMVQSAHNTALMLERGMSFTETGVVASGRGGVDDEFGELKTVSSMASISSTPTDADGETPRPSPEAPSPAKDDKPRDALTQAGIAAASARRRVGIDGEEKKSDASLTEKKDDAAAMDDAAGLSRRSSSRTTEGGPAGIGEHGSFRSAADSQWDDEGEATETRASASPEGVIVPREARGGVDHAAGAVGAGHGHGRRSPSFDSGGMTPESDSEAVQKGGHPHRHRGESVERQFSLDRQHLQSALIETRYRYLNVVKRRYWHLFENGAIGSDAFETLIEATSSAEDHLTDPLNEWDAVVKDVGADWGRNFMTMATCGEWQTFEAVSYEYELVTGFLRAHERIDAEIRHIIKNPSALTQVRMEARDVLRRVRAVRAQAETVREVTRAVQTRHAIFQLLRLQEEKAKKLCREGEIEESELERILERLRNAWDSANLATRIDMTDEEALRQVGYLRNLDESTFAAICEAGQVLTYDPGDVLMFQGQRSRGFFVILSGFVDVRHIPGLVAAPPIADRVEAEEKRAKQVQKRLRLAAVRAVNIRSATAPDEYGATAVDDVELDDDDEDAGDVGDGKEGDDDGSGSGRTSRASRASRASRDGGTPQAGDSSRDGGAIRANRTASAGIALLRRISGTGPAPGGLSSPISATRSTSHTGVPGDDESSAPAGKGLERRDSIHDRLRSGVIRGAKRASSSVAEVTRSVSRALRVKKAMEDAAPHSVEICKPPVVPSEYNFATELGITCTQDGLLLSKIGARDKKRWNAKRASEEDEQGGGGSAVLAPGSRGRSSRPDAWADQEPQSCCEYLSASLQACWDILTTGRAQAHSPAPSPLPTARLESGGIRADGELQGASDASIRDPMLLFGPAVDHLESGSVVGVLSMLTGHRSIMTAVATTSTRVFFIPQAAIFKRLKSVAVPGRPFRQVQPLENVLCKMAGVLVAETSIPRLHHLNSQQMRKLFAGATLVRPEAFQPMRISGDYVILTGAELCPRDAKKGNLVAEHVARAGAFGFRNDRVQTHSHSKRTTRRRKHRRAYDADSTSTWSAHSHQRHVPDHRRESSSEKEGGGRDDRSASGSGDDGLGAGVGSGGAGERRRGESTSSEVSLARETREPDDDAGGYASDAHESRTSEDGRALVTADSSASVEEGRPTREFSGPELTKSDSAAPVHFEDALGVHDTCPLPQLIPSDTVPDGSGSDPSLERVESSYAVEEIREVEIPITTAEAKEGSDGSEGSGDGSGGSGGGDGSYNLPGGAVGVVVAKRAGSSPVGDVPAIQAETPSSTAGPTIFQPLYHQAARRLRSRDFIVSGERVTLTEDDFEPRARAPTFQKEDPDEYRWFSWNTRLLVFSAGLIDQIEAEYRRQRTEERRRRARMHRRRAEHERARKLRAEERKRKEEEAAEGVTGGPAALFQGLIPGAHPFATSSPSATVRSPQGRRSMPPAINHYMSEPVHGSDEARDEGGVHGTSKSTGIAGAPRHVAPGVATLRAHSDGSAATTPTTPHGGALFGPDVVVAGRHDSSSYFETLASRRHPESTTNGEHRVESKLSRPAVVRRAHSFSEVEAGEKDGGGGGGGGDDDEEEDGHGRGNTISSLRHDSALYFEGFERKSRKRRQSAPISPGQQPAPFLSKLFGSVRFNPVTIEEEDEDDVKSPPSPPQRSPKRPPPPLSTSSDKPPPPPPKK